MEGFTDQLLRRRWLRYGLIAALVLVLFRMGVNSDAVFAKLTAAWQWGFSVLNLGAQARNWQHEVSPHITTRSLPAMLTFGGIYTGVSVLLIGLLLGPGAPMRLVLRAYLGAFVLCTGLLVVGKLGGDLAGPYRAARQLIYCLVSPLPVVVLVPLLRWHQRHGKSIDLQ